MKSTPSRGVTLHREDPGFDQAVLATSFNSRDPGHRPKVLVQVNDVFDVIAAVKRAAREQLKVSICSGGHSWAQNHIREGGMLIDASRLQGVEIDAANKRAIVGPGCGGSVLVGALKKYGLFFPAGHCKGVCLGGYLLQGGFGWNSRALGMACESVIGLDVVMADGSLVHASEEENADIYWAARGAGPGFFGVVVRFHLKLHDCPRFIGNVTQVYRMSHLEEVFRWTDAVGASVPNTVEFQLIMSRKALAIGEPGIEVHATVMADSRKAAKADVAFLLDCPLRAKSGLASPLFPAPLKIMYDVVMTHYPNGMRWGVDNMWTNASVDHLMPGLLKVAATLPPAPSHMLWLNWSPPPSRPSMAYSLEAKTYIALYGEWKHESDDRLYADWAADRVREWDPWSVGIQLADENLGQRAAPFAAQPTMTRLDQIRSTRDPGGRFQSWMGRA